MHNTPGHGEGGQGTDVCPKDGDRAGRSACATCSSEGSPSARLPAPLTQLARLPRCSPHRPSAWGRLSPCYKERLAGGRGSPEWVFSSICGGFPAFLSRSVNSDIRKGDQEFLRRRYQCCQGLLTCSFSQKPGPPSRDADKSQRPDVISGVGGDGETKAECGPKFGLWLERERAGAQFPGKPGPRAGTQDLWQQLQTEAGGRGQGPFL